MTDTLIHLAVGVIAAVSFATLIVTLRGHGLADDLHDADIGAEADPQTMAPEQHKVYQRIMRRWNVAFYLSLIGTVAGIGYLSFTSTVFAIGWMIFCGVLYLVARYIIRPRDRRQARRTNGGSWPGL